MAWAGFKEGVHQKAFYSLFFFGLLIIASSLVLNQMTVGDKGKIVADLGLSAISLFGFLIITFMGINQMHQELEEKIVYTILSKSITRSEYILGKFFGLLAIIFLNILVMSSVILLLLLITRTLPFLPLLGAVYLAFVELFIITALAVFFTTFLMPGIGMFSLFAIFIIGHSTSELVQLLGEKTGLIAPKLARAAYYFFPNFDYFDIKLQVVHNLRISPFHLPFATLYAIFYSAILLFAAVLIFRRREF